MTHRLLPRMTARPIRTRAARALTTCALAVAVLGSAASVADAQAGRFTDPAGDLLATYTGPRNADLDVLNGAFSFNGSAFHFSATLAGPAGSTPGALYVWGINRGMGTARFSPSLPNTENILFDAVVILTAGGTSSVRDLLTGGVSNLGIADVDFIGNSIFARVGVGLLPSTGFAPSAFTANLWPRVGAGNNNQIADFAPDNRNIAVATVPEPATLVLLAPLATGLLVLARRRRAQR